MDKITTIEDFFNYYENYSSTEEYFNILKESYDLHLMSVAKKVPVMLEKMDVDIMFYEEKAEDVKNKIQEMVKKFKGFLVKLLEKLIGLITGEDYRKKQDDLNQKLKDLEAELNAVNRDKDRIKDQANERIKFLEKVCKERHKSILEYINKWGVELNKNVAKDSVIEDILGKLNLSEDIKSVFYKALLFVNNTEFKVKCAVKRTDLSEIADLLDHISAERDMSKNVAKLKTIVGKVNFNYNVSEDQLNKYEVSFDVRYLKDMKATIHRSIQKHDTDKMMVCDGNEWELDKDTIEILNHAQMIITSFVRKATFLYNDMNKVIGILDYTFKK